MTAAIIASILDDLTDLLSDIGGEWWFLFVILAIAFVDAFFPVVPSETAVIIGGVVAGTTGDQNLVLVIGCAALGAFCGDNVSYTIGHRFSGRVDRRAAKRPKLAKRLRWARGQIRTRGGPLLVTARFVPGGRTALTITSGLTNQPRHWFASWIALAAVIWASYAASLGYVAGDRFKDNHTAAFLIAFAAALSITLLIELVRNLRSKRTQSDTGELTVESVEEALDATKDSVEDSDERTPPLEREA